MEIRRKREMERKEKGNKGKERRRRRRKDQQVFPSTDGALTDGIRRIEKQKYQKRWGGGGGGGGGGAVGFVRRSSKM